MSKKKFKIVDLFAGVGGLSFGFSHDPDYEIIAANEILPEMAKAYQLNHPLVKVYCKDIVDFGFSDLKKDLGVKKGEIDIVVGGPPCQAYSTVGKRLIDDPRGKLFQEYYRILKELQPKLFVFENVKGLLSMGNGELLPTIIELFNSLNYNIQFKVLDAANYGAPQHRERVVIVGTKLGSVYSFPKPTHGHQNLFDPEIKPFITLFEALSDLPLNISKDENFYVSDPQNEFQRMMRVNSENKIQDHVVSTNNERLVKLMSALPEGGTPKDLPVELRPKSGFGNSYSRLWSNRPCTTLTRNFGTPSSARCIHPIAARPLSTREGARIQGFPDNYNFFGSLSVKNLQIGNAVSPFLSIALAKSLKQFFIENDEMFKTQ
jgi:DNA (cytosine-5)-methyltransferase 1